jgi:predicted 3-demethylubiquinone-9 3-methyltransferase (glyoxalase superfamily)
VLQRWQNLHSPSLPGLDRGSPAFPSAEALDYYHQKKASFTSHLNGIESNQMTAVQKIVPFLWFDDQAEEAATFYTGIFKNSRVARVARYGEEGFAVHGRSAGSVMTVEFELEGQRFTALNGGPLFQFNQAVSLVILCESQEEIDHYWDRLAEGADPASQQCGWLKDKFGLSWQVVPTALPEIMAGPDPEKSGRAMTALLQMKKLDIAKLKQAYDG